MQDPKCQRSRPQLSPYACVYTCLLTRSNQKFEHCGLNHARSTFARKTHKKYIKHCHVCSSKTHPEHAQFISIACSQISKKQLGLHCLRSLFKPRAEQLHLKSFASVDPVGSSLPTWQNHPRLRSVQECSRTRRAIKLKFALQNLRRTRRTPTTASMTNPSTLIPQGTACIICIELRTRRCLLSSLSR